MGEGMSKKQVRFMQGRRIGSRTGSFATVENHPLVDGRIYPGKTTKMVRFWDLQLQDLANLGSVVDITCQSCQHSSADSGEVGPVIPI